MSISESYPGEDALISYIKERRNKASYWGFLNNYHDIIVTSAFSDDWCELNNTWTARFLHETKDLPDFKDKIITERTRYVKRLQIFWQEIIKECKKENLVPKSIKLIDFCHSILQELDNKSNIHPFYKYDEKENPIKNPMDFFTINSKLNDNQYTSAKDFEKDIRLIFRNCYTYNNIGSEIYKLEEALELAFNKIWTEKIIFLVKQKEKSKRVRDNDTNSSSELVKKQIRILEENKDKLVYRQVVNDGFLIASAYENLVAGNIPFIEILKTFLSTRSQMSLFSANEPVLQAIVESLLPLKYHVPELSLVIDGTKLKGSGRFGYSDIFVLKGIGNNNVSLELKYISLVNLIKNQKNKFNANDLENLGKIIEKENEKDLLKRSYAYWLKEHEEIKQTTIGEVLDNGVDQLKTYMNIISKGKIINYSSSGIFDKRVKITESNPTKLKGFVILVIGFHRILWRSIEEIITNYSYDKI
ncbi:unnamed protein product [Rhizophagus irregularis]|uniref:Bromo domain-containing protein n=2 Tax=Rhizophagus irregularis TaxID=588596 RepID=A0A915ZXS7_9GLOM|nr:unnamed protein product [Rhizophagus irregularis]CAB5392900.1 unnamed protein product [Rhizophagus irregularis]